LLNLEPADALYNGQFAITDLTRGTFDQDTLNDSLQRGDFTGPGGWTWFSLQLSNGTQYMLYFLKDADGNLNQVVATQVNADGTYESLPASEVSYKALGSWTSPSTKITYEQNWQVTLPGGQLTVDALLPDQEVTNLSVQDYWEGDSSVTGTIDGQAVTGQSYVEVQPTFTVPQPGQIGSRF
jgi:predicted secreted hydrolase